MKHFQGRIPKGNQRRSLKASNRCNKITVNRQMNAAQVKTVIMEAFSDLPEFWKFSDTDRLEMECTHVPVR